MYIKVGALVDQLPRLLQSVETDMTLSFRNLAHANVQPASQWSNEVLMEPIAQLAIDKAAAGDNSLSKRPRG